MRETGIVRRIDELGRVVIPKEIRKTQRIRTGDSLEIYTDGNGGVIFKKYSPLAELGEPAAVYADVLARRLRCAESFFKLFCRSFKGILRKKPAVSLKRLYIIKAKLNILFGYVIIVFVFI